MGFKKRSPSAARHTRTGIQNAISWLKKAKSQTYRGHKSQPRKY